MLVVCYKSIREDVKRCTANGLIVVGDRKWWSTLSDSPTALGCSVGGGIRRSFTAVPYVLQTQNDDHRRLCHVTHRVQKEHAFESTF